MLIRGLLLFLLIYTFYRSTVLDKHIKVNIIGLALMGLCSTTKEMLLVLNLDYWYYNVLIYGFQTSIIVVYLIFYNNDVFSEQLKWFIPLHWKVIVLEIWSFSKEN